MLAFKGRENRGKTCQSKEENQQTQLPFDAESRNRTWSTLVKDECSHQHAIPAPLRR